MAEPLLGRVLWYELLTTDTKAAQSFYTKGVGWTLSPFEGQSPGEYDVFMRDGNVGVGGVMKIPEGMNFPPHWGMYVGVPKLEDAVARIERLGGSGLSALIEVPEVGRMRTMKDPQGAAFSILEPSMEGDPAADREPQPGDASWHELYTTDAESALRFYTTLFGCLATEAIYMGAMGKYHRFARGKGFGGGLMNKPAEMAQVPPHWGFYFLVPDVHQAAERVKANGGQVLNGPMEVPGGDWVVNCMDPQGAAFSLHHKKS
jgi:predicted enzyme related to lactoylglutathione lyase